MDILKASSIQLSGPREVVFGKKRISLLAQFTSLMLRGSLRNSSV
jgi:hypothetical protein